MNFTETEQEVIHFFKAAGIQGRAFRTQDACFAYLERTWKAGVMCPGYGRKIASEACNWHREERDPLCLRCGKQSTENRNGGTFSPKSLTGKRPERYESV